MTQKNINTMDIVVGLLSERKPISYALHKVYSKRTVAIPYNESAFSAGIEELNLANRTSNALRRAHLATISDVIEFATSNGITKVKTLGRSSGIELFEAILDYCWAHMNNEERTNFLIRTVERNSNYIREELR